jgi:alpha-glucosidase
MNHSWWQTAVFYQIYPRSFADNNGDGIGDIPGIINKLAYLQDLGIDAIWLSPHYPSPLFDCGYDIADYTAVAPEYGTLSDFKAMLAAAHQHGMRVILDLVLNHTSDQHPWFLESRSSRNSPKRDWFIWRDGKNGRPPNNWNSTFGGSAWEYDPQTDQYFYHFFFKQQPDLNWRNPDVKQAMFSAVRFWLGLGVDGYRLDAIGTIYEHPEMPDHKARYSLPEIRMLAEAAKTRKERYQIGLEWKRMFRYQVEQPGVHQLVQELREVIDEYEDRVLVGETEDLAYHGNGSNELHMVFNFPLKNTQKLTPAGIRSNQRKRLSELSAINPNAWPCNTLGNHDSPRIFNHFGDGMHNDQIARLSLALMLTLRGTPFLYNGEEIGMTDLELKDIAQFRDQLGIWLYQAELEFLNYSPDKALCDASQLTRDKNRTPFQWKNAPNGGFSPEGVETWLPVNPNYAQGINANDQQENPLSLLNFYKAMLRIRQNTPALQTGDYSPLFVNSRSVLAFLRRTSNQSILVALNFTALARPVQLATTIVSQVVFSTNERKMPFGNPSKIRLAPFEIFIAKLV